MNAAIGVLPIADDELDVDAGMAARESREHLRGEILRRRHHADGNASARQRLERRQARCAIGEHDLDPLGRSQHLAAGDGQSNAATVALEQRQADFCLELTHLHGDGGRRDVARRGSGGEGAAARRRAQESKLLDGDVMHRSCLVQFSE